jgi:hypothetical protein
VSGRPRLRTFAWPASAAAALALLVPATARAQERTVETATNGTVTGPATCPSRQKGNFFAFVLSMSIQAEPCRPCGLPAIRLRFR